MEGGHAWLEREVTRCRDRLHDLEGAAGLTSVRLDGHQRRLDDLSRELRAVSGKLQELGQHEEIAQAVAAHLNERRLSSLQLWGIRVAILSAIASGVLQLVQAL